MKFLAWSISGVALAVFVTGCQPDLAQVKPGSQEEYWEQFVDRSYSGFRPSRTAPPAIADKVSPELREAEQQEQPAAGETQSEQLPAVNAADVAPADDPVTVEVAEDKATVIAPEADRKAGDGENKAAVEKPAASFPCAAPGSSDGCFKAAESAVSSPVEARSDWSAADSPSESGRNAPRCDRTSWR